METRNVELGRYQFAHESRNLIDHIRLVERFPSMRFGANPRNNCSFFFSNSTQFIAYIRSPDDDSIITRFPGTATVSHLDPPTLKSITRNRDLFRRDILHIIYVRIFSPLRAHLRLLRKTRFEKLYNTCAVYI